MSLTIELKLNGKLIGGAIVTNKSNLADISDYEVEAVETAAPGVTGHDQDFRAEFTIKDFPRNQSVWALVDEVAHEAANRRKSGKHDQEPRDRGETL